MKFILCLKFKNHTNNKNIKFQNYTFNYKI